MEIVKSDHRNSYSNYALFRYNVSLNSCKKNSNDCLELIFRKRNSFQFVKLSSAGGNIISPLYLKAFFLGLSSFMPIPIPFFSFISNFSCYFEKGHKYYGELARGAHFLTSNYHGPFPKKKKKKTWATTSWNSIHLRIDFFKNFNSDPIVIWMKIDGSKLAKQESL